ncbi:MAG: HK97 gp10 family phage protein [Rhodocyclaceae bacterium]|nr:HK97 gp10 family phage protein [Rhodocyclaceae bacterium]
MSDVHVKGLSELQAFLDQLPAKMEANIMRSALRAGAKVVAAEAKRNVPIEHGDLRDSIRVSARLKGGKVTSTIKAGNKKAWYWRFVEFGTAAHTIKSKDGGVLRFASGIYKSVDHPGAKSHPFMRPALDSQTDAAIQAVGEQIKKRLTKQGLNAADVDIEIETE